MIRISESERKAILKKYPDAWLKSTKHHTYLTGYESSFTVNYLKELRRGKPQQKPKPAHKGSRKPRRG
jgi:hypothetical protein